ncbi:hypothetical protein [Archangium violaceum]|uniref:hypothetical protein n=1 Tax=Archangium violaceum TaxID=83451 RepID=UPI000698C270|nr:hypothetical protein [Archangium violaceum]
MREAARREAARRARGVAATGAGGATGAGAAGGGAAVSGAGVGAGVAGADGVGAATAGGVASVGMLARSRSRGVRSGPIAGPWEARRVRVTSASFDTAVDRASTTAGVVLSAWMVGSTCFMRSTYQDSARPRLRRREASGKRPCQ